MNLTGVDVPVLIAYFALAAGIGFVFGRGQRTTEDYFLGGRRIPWIVAAASLFATEVSALTVIGVPAKAFESDFWYLQYFFGSALARVCIAFVFLPAFYGHRVTTVYEYLGLRFGRWTRGMGTLLFFVSRLLGSGVRLLAAAIALSTVTGLALNTTIALITLIVVAYVCFGGIRAIVWTDAFQAVIFIGGAAVLLLYQGATVTGGFAEAFNAAHAAGKLRLFHFGAGLNNDTDFVLGLVNGFFVTFAALGTDQDLTQRLLTCRNVGQSQRSILITAVVGFPVVMLFLSLGTMIFVFMRERGLSLPVTLDQVYPWYIVNHCPTGVRGLLVAGVFAAAMSSLSSALGALSSSAVVDVYRPYLRRDASEQHYLWTSRLLVLGFGAVLIGIARGFAGHPDVLRLAFQVASLVFGPLLGVFLLGTLTHRGRDAFNVASMLIAQAALLILHFYQIRAEIIWLAWPWYIVLGTLATFTLGAVRVPQRKNA